MNRSPEIDRDENKLLVDTPSLSEGDSAHTKRLHLMFNSIKHKYAPAQHSNPNLAHNRTAVPKGHIYSTDAVVIIKIPCIQHNKRAQSTQNGSRGSREKGGRLCFVAGRFHLEVLGALYKVLCILCLDFCSGASYPFHSKR